MNRFGSRRLVTDAATCRGPTGRAGAAQSPSRPGASRSPSPDRRSAPWSSSLSSPRPRPDREPAARRPAETEPAAVGDQGQPARQRIPRPSTLTGSARSAVRLDAECRSSAAPGSRTAGRAVGEPLGGELDRGLCAVAVDAGPAASDAASTSDTSRPTASRTRASARVAADVRGIRIRVIAVNAVRSPPRVVPPLALASPCRAASSAGSGRRPASVEPVPARPRRDRRATGDHVRRPVASLAEIRSRLSKIVLNHPQSPDQRAITRGRPVAASASGKCTSNRRMSSRSLSLVRRSAAWTGADRSAQRVRQLGGAVGELTVWHMWTCRP